VHPLSLALPSIIVISGLVAFVLLPLELPIRLAVLGTDIVAAVLVGVILNRRNNSK
jgi:hypothetical protein